MEPELNPDFPPFEYALMNGVLQFVRHRRLPKFRKSRVGKIPTGASVGPTKTEIALAASILFPLL